MIHRQPILRAALVSLLNGVEDFHVVGDTASCAEYRRRLRALQPHVLVCDLPPSLSCESPQIDTMRTVNPYTPVVLVTAHDAQAQVVALARLGFKGLLTADAPSSALFEAIRTVSGGGNFLDRAAQAILVEAVGADTRRGPASSNRLTTREQRVIELIAQGMTNADIAAALRVSTGTVKQCVGSLLRKLGAPNRTAVVRIAVAQGLLA